MLYTTYFGGVSGMTREQYEAINGFSNSFFGWGGEDDDLYNRLELCVFCFIFRNWEQFENNLFFP